MESLVENKQILHGLASGVITGIFASIIIFWKLSGKIDDFLFSIIYQQLLASGLSGEKALEIANKTIGELKWIHWLTVVSPIINMTLLGALLGLLTHVFIKKTGLKPWAASIATGLVLVLLLQLLPLLVLKTYTPYVVEALEEYIGLPVILVPSIMFTILLVVFNTLKGPWRKWGEAKPEIY